MARGEDHVRTAAEWVTTTVCVALIALLCAAILYEGYAAGDDAPARVEVAVDPAGAEQRGELWYVPFEVVNHGDETIEEIWVVVEAEDGGETVAESETTVALLGESERVHAVAVFEDDPRGFELGGRVRSFQVAEDV